MTMRDESTKGRTPGQGQGASTSDAMEQKMLAFAEQLGRIVGTVQAKAEGWLDRDALNAQISTVRDSAAELLDHLGGGKTRNTQAGNPKRSASSTPPKSAKPAARSPKSGGATAKPAARSKPPAKNSTVASKVRASGTSGAPASSTGTGRSGGAVDAPGKKHRKPMPSESAATGNPRGAGSRIAKLKMANETRIMRRRG
jgi:hypothetical protein